MDLPETLLEVINPTPTAPVKRSKDNYKPKPKPKMVLKKRRGKMPTLTNNQRVVLGRVLRNVDQYATLFPKGRKE